MSLSNLSKVLLLTLAISLSLCQETATTLTLVDDYGKNLDCPKGCQKCIPMPNGVDTYCESCSGMIHQMTFPDKGTCIAGTPIPNCLVQREVTYAELSTKTVKTAQECVSCEAGYGPGTTMTMGNVQVALECKKLTLEKSKIGFFNLQADGTTWIEFTQGCESGYVTSSSTSCIAYSGKETVRVVENCFSYSNNRCQSCTPGYRLITSQIYTTDPKESDYLQICIPVGIEYKGCGDQGLWEHGCDGCDYAQGWWIKSVFIDSRTDGGDESYICTNAAGDIAPKDEKGMKKLLMEKL